MAGSGTLFLDEVGELPQALQVKLLRALQERKIRRVGGSADLAVAARIIAATNRDLGEEVKAGRFREDLFYRLNVIQLKMPPLRERREDLPRFLDHFLDRFATELGRSRPAVAPEAQRLLLAYAYPGNVRELANVVERAVTLCDGDVVGPALLPPAVRGAAAALPVESGTALPAGGPRPPGAPRRDRAGHPGAGDRADGRGEDRGRPPPQPHLPLAPLPPRQVRHRRRVAAPPDQRLFPLLPGLTPP